MSEPIATAACPRLRPTLDIARVRSADGPLICLYDPQDQHAGQLLLSEPALLLASLLDGQRTVAQLPAAFALRTGIPITERQVAQLVDQLDAANLLDSERHQALVRAKVEQFRVAAVRAAVHAGGAYPGDPAALRTFLDARYTLDGGPGAPPGPVRGPSPRALVAPHIDLHRGGHSYAWGYRELAEHEPAELYVLLGTCHRPMSTPFATTAKPYATPLGPVRADPGFLERLVRLAPFDSFADEYAHCDEHSLEFQALYLRYLGFSGGQGPATVVPILCVPPADLSDGATPEDSGPVREFLEALHDTIAEDGRRVCLIVGADFAHVGPQFGDPEPVDGLFADQVRRGDLEMLVQIASGDAGGFYRQVVDEAPRPGMAGDICAVGGPRRICGLAPIYALLWLLGPSEGRVLHYDQWIGPGGSGSVTFGCVVFP